MSKNPTKRRYDPLKRAIDVLGAIIGLIAFSPVMIAIALWIKLVSPNGPVFADIPKRVGRNYREFFLYKFRSMVPNAQEYLRQHPELYELYKKNNYKIDSKIDPRIIRGGRIFRKTSMDETPQFINILKGEMSLVGPRAYFPFELHEQMEKYPETRPYVEKLVTVKPGLTGLWQVGGRSDVSFPERVKLDAYYAQNCSLWLDIKIILKTPWVLLTGKGAT